MKYNVHILIASFILLTHLSEQGEYAHKTTIQCLAGKYQVLPLLMHPCLMKYNVYVLNSKFLSF